MDKIEELMKNYLVSAEAKKAKLKPVPKALVEKPKSRLGISRAATGGLPAGRQGRHYVIAGMLISFALSFIFPKYFLQCLVVTLILGVRWALNSEGGRTLIMVLDSWRQHSHSQDEEISHRLRK